jgi:HlyD family secretion protein
MRKKRLKWITLILFIGINCLLVWLDDGDKVTRQAYVSSWGKVYQKDLFETVEAAGVVSYSGESYVYFDKNMGSFENFLIEEGITVSVGDPLFEYKVNDYYETEAYLSYELSKVESEIDAIEDAISEMVAFRIPKPSTPVVGDTNKDSTTVVVAPQEPAEAEVLKEQFIIQKEQELSAKEEQKKVIKSQLDDLEETGDTITVESPFQGKVKEVSATLNDPIIRIENTALLVKGEIGEAARLELESGQAVDIVLKESEQTLKGSVLQVADAPHEVDVNTQSIYPVEVSFEEEQALDSILPGYRADLTITVNESINAATVKRDFVKQNHIWKLNELGRMDLVPVQTGIQMGEHLEIQSGLSTGNMVTDESISASFKGMPFITPLKFKDVAWLDIGKYKDWLLYMTVGLVAR